MCGFIFLWKRKQCSSEYNNHNILRIFEMEYTKAHGRPILSLEEVINERKEKKKEAEERRT